MNDTKTSSPTIDDISNLDSKDSTPNIMMEKKTISPQQVAENIKDAARRIREASSSMRDTVRTIRESGAINELLVILQKTLTKLPEI
jgi:hypothetical protein